MLITIRRILGVDRMATLGEGERLRLTCGPVRLEMGLAEIYDRSGLEPNATLA